MVRPVLRSERLELRAMTLEHLPLLIALDADPEVLRHILGRARGPREARDFWTPKCVDTAADALGLGWWVGFTRPDRDDELDFVGWWTLSPGSIDGRTPHATERAEAGWRLARRHWGKGLASEGAVTVFDHGFTTVGLDAIWAETAASNVGSRGVMRRLGMQHVHTEHDQMIHEVTRSQWLSLRD